MNRGHGYRYNKGKKYSLWQRTLYRLDAPFRNRRQAILYNDSHAYYIEPNIVEKILAYVWFLLTTWIGWFLILLVVVIFLQIKEFLF